VIIFRALDPVPAPQIAPVVRGTAAIEPRLAVPWEKSGRKWFENLRALVSPGAKLKKYSGKPPFYECWVRQGRVPARTVAASAVWHGIAFVLLARFGTMLVGASHQTVYDGFELTWSGPIEDLPLLAPRAMEKKAPAVPAHENKTAPATDIPKPDAFHPTQTIISAPKIPTHPRQTLIQPDTPPEAPKVLPELPNIAILADEPSRPRLQITAEALARIKPKQPMAKPEASAAIPELANREMEPADINFASSDAPAPPKASLLKAGAAMVAAPKKNQTAGAAESAEPIVSGGDSNRTIIAISATPAPAAPAPVVPAGNLAAKVAIAPEAPSAAGGGGAVKPGGSPGGASAPGVSISGGAPKSSSVISGLGGARGDTSRALHVAPGMAAPKSDAPAAAALKPSLAERLKSGTPPEKLLGGQIYTLHANAPNLASATGSWIFNFAELGDGEETTVIHHPTGELARPVPVRKVDPRYPPALVEAKVQGEVILYAIVRENGTIDSIQLVHGIDPTLDQNAIEALALWKFEPARRNGVPVALEAVVHIPFRAVAPQY
jgi:TonB family protein